MAHGGAERRDGSTSPRSPMEGGKIEHSPMHEVPAIAKCLDVMLDSIDNSACKERLQHVAF